MEKNTKNKFITYLFALFAIALFSSGSFQTAKAQKLSTGVDLYSTYVWRGVAYSGPSIQPYVEFSSGGFSIGAWGSQGIDGSVADGTVGFQEMDLYAGYSFDFGLSLGITDYYYPGTPFFEYDGDAASHAIELNGGYEIDIVSLSANYIVNEAPLGAGSAGGDLYFELGLAIDDNANIFVGAGDGWHSSDGDFNLVNLGIGTSKEIKVTDSFSLPLSGSAILNPDTEQFYIVVGLSL